MQRKWILGLSTVMVLAACEQNYQETDIANTNQPSTLSKDTDPLSLGGKPKQEVKALPGSIAPQASVDIVAELAAQGAAPLADTLYLPNHPLDTENYAPIADGPVKQAALHPVSTFSIDVDTGSYANVRRFLMNGQLPPKDAVRVEEMINYFSYDYPRPEDRQVPFSVTADTARTPWNSDTYLLRIAVGAASVESEDRPPANLVFLIDVSGSMSDPDKLPLLKAGMKLLTRQMRSDDTVSIVVYAGAAGLVLEPTPGDRQHDIIDAIERLEAGGSTAGGEGLALAYAQAEKARIAGGINRVILATDGDFNVGITDIEELKRIIEVNRDSGVSLTALGFGEGNYNDALMEQIADVGNGNYGYVDSLKEAKRLLVDELGGTIQTVAKDVKIQVEFNPAIVAEYRLIGYENRALQRQDFNNDRKDAGEIGAGHTVTALYEVALKGSRGLSMDPLRYTGANDGTTSEPDQDVSEFAYLRLRYKLPEETRSRLIEQPLALAQLVDDHNPSADFRFAAAIAAFGQLLRQGDHVIGFDYDQVASLAQAAKGEDPDGYRAEFIELVEIAKALSPHPGEG